MTPTNHWYIIIVNDLAIELTSFYQELLMENQLLVPTMTPVGAQHNPSD